METLKYFAFIIAYYVAINLIVYSSYKTIGTVILGFVMMVLWFRSERKEG